MPWLVQQSTLQAIRLHPESLNGKLMFDFLDNVKIAIIAFYVIIGAPLVFIGVTIMRYTTGAGSQPYTNTNTNNSYDRSVAENPPPGAYDINTSIAFNAPTITTIVITPKTAVFNLELPIKDGQDQPSHCFTKGDLNDYNFQLTTRDGDLDPIDTFCLHNPPGTTLPFDQNKQSYIDHATFRLSPSFGYPITFKYRGWGLGINLSHLKERTQRP